MVKSFWGKMPKMSKKKKMLLGTSILIVLVVAGLLINNMLKDPDPEPEPEQVFEIFSVQIKFAEGADRKQQIKQIQLHLANILSIKPTDIIITETKEQFKNNLREMFKSVNIKLQISIKKSGNENSTLFKKSTKKLRTRFLKDAVKDAVKTLLTNTSSTSPSESPPAPSSPPPLPPTSPPQTPTSTPQTPTPTPQTPTTTPQTPTSTPPPPCCEYFYFDNLNGTESIINQNSEVNNTDIARFRTIYKTEPKMSDIEGGNDTIIKKIFGDNYKNNYKENNNIFNAHTFTEEGVHTKFNIINNDITYTHNSPIDSESVRIVPTINITKGQFVHIKLVQEEGLLGATTAAGVGWGFGDEGADILLPECCGADRTARARYVPQLGRTGARTVHFFIKINIIGIFPFTRNMNTQARDYVIFNINVT